MGCGSSKLVKVPTNPPNQQQLSQISTTTQNTSTDQYKKDESVCKTPIDVPVHPINIVELPVHYDEVKSANQNAEDGRRGISTLTAVTMRSTDSSDLILSNLEISTSVADTSINSQLDVRSIEISTDPPELLSSNSLNYSEDDNCVAGASPILQLHPDEQDAAVLRLTDHESKEAVNDQEHQLLGSGYSLTLSTDDTDSCQAHSSSMQIQEATEYVQASVSIDPGMEESTVASSVEDSVGILKQIEEGDEDIEVVSTAAAITTIAAAEEEDPVEDNNMPTAVAVPPTVSSTASSSSGSSRSGNGGRGPPAKRTSTLMTRPPITSLQRGDNSGTASLSGEIAQAGGNAPRGMSLQSHSAANSTSIIPPATKTGTLRKEGHVNKNWKYRFFKLDLGDLQYFENEAAAAHATNRKGSISMDKIEIEVVDKIIIKLTRPSNEDRGQMSMSLSLEIPDAALRTAWVDAFREHSAYLQRLHDARNIGTSSTSGKTTHVTRKDASNPFDAIIKETATMGTDSTIVETPPALKKGFILKEGHMIKNWKNRYFVLEAGKLSYYEDSSSSPPYGVNFKGSFELRSAVITTKDNLIKLVKNATISADSSGGGNAASSSQKRSSIFGQSSASSENNSLTLEVPFASEREEWISEIKRHIVYYSSRR